MVKLIATKSLTYATRRLVAGSPFEATVRDARILTAIKKARLAAAEAEAAEAAVVPAEDNNDTLRTRAETLGIRVDGRWSEARLQREIDARSSAATAPAPAPAEPGPAPSEPPAFANYYSGRNDATDDR